ncbi:MAG: hypothetical protein D6775_00955, partial [Caldilineae bacterium]
VEQLAEGGNMVIPIGPAGWDQMLWQATKLEGALVKHRIAPVRFVPLVEGSASAGKEAERSDETTGNGQET